MSGRMVISILSISVKALEMPCVEVVDAVAARAGDLKPDDYLKSLTSNVRIQVDNFILNPVLPFCHFFWSLTSIV